MTSETALSAEWATLRDSLSKAYVAADIDAALRYSRPRIEAAARSQPATEGLDVERLADAIEAYVRSAKGDPSPWARNAEDIATDLAAEYAALAATEPAATGETEFYDDGQRIMPEDA